MSNTTKNAPRYIVKTARARMPGSCWSGMSYYRTAILRLVDGAKASDVTMISERARAVEEVVEEWGPSYSGKTDRCAHARDVAEAEDYCAYLNGTAIAS